MQIFEKQMYMWNFVINNKRKEKNKVIHKKIQKKEYIIERRIRHLIVNRF